LIQPDKNEICAEEFPLQINVMANLSCYLINNVIFVTSKVERCV